VVFHNKLWWRLQSQFKYFLKLNFDRPVVIPVATTLVLIIVRYLCAGLKLEKIYFWSPTWNYGENKNNSRKIKNNS